KNGKIVRRGQGLAFWFSPIGANVTEVPLDDRELPFLVQARSADFQEVAVQGVVTYRIKEPEVIALRIDLSLDTRTGAFTKDPFDKLAGILGQLAHQIVVADLTRRP